MAALIPVNNPDFVLTGQAQVWWKPWIFGTPAALPADTLLLGDAWTSPWKAVGATKEGVSARFDRTVTNITVEEVSQPVDQRTSSSGFTFTMQLSEDTLDTMLLAYGGGTITTLAAAAGTKGKKTLVIAEEVDYISIGLESMAAPREAVTSETPWRRMVIDKVSSAAQVETAYRRAANQRVYPVTFTSLTPIADCPIVELDADATP